MLHNCPTDLAQGFERDPVHYSLLHLALPAPVALSHLPLKALLVELRVARVLLEDSPDVQVSLKLPV